MDVQAWSGLTKLREVVDRLAPKLRTFANEKGGVLYDVPDAPLPDPDTPAPPRFLPEYDNLLLSHDDRTRVIDDGRAVPLPPGNGAKRGTLLVDGFFRGMWNLDGTTLWVSPFAPLATADADAVSEEAYRLVAFLGGDDVRVSDS
ncbi:DNA glycosylase AlkZ-like family protein [Tenggerimyces flavus]|uniref:DNA glycosylase AlkZ-like family protein n=2 Tax=Tenggerimyces flavus TaxID=1708749 RepID=A0ABV7YHH7_9ACTN